MQKALGGLQGQQVRDGLFEFQIAALNGAVGEIRGVEMSLRGRAGSDGPYEGQQFGGGLSGGNPDDVFRFLSFLLSFVSVFYCVLQTNKILIPGPTHGSWPLLGRTPPQRQSRFKICFMCVFNLSRFLTLFFGKVPCG